MFFLQKRFRGGKTSCFLNTGENQTERKFANLPHAGKERWAFVVAKPACNVWTQVALYHMDISIPEKAKKRWRCNCCPCYLQPAFLLWSCSRHKPIHGPCKVFLTSHVLPLLQPTGQKSLKGFHNGMNQLPLPSSLGGWCMGPRF